jgi:hypothetical protein
MIKSFRIAYRNSFVFLFICFLSFFIQIYLQDSTNLNEIVFHFHDWSHLKEQNLFISFIQIEHDQHIFSQIKHFIDQHHPLTNLIQLNNITNIIQFQQFFFSKTISRTTEVLCSSLGVTRHRMTLDKSLMAICPRSSGRCILITGDLNQVLWLDCVREAQVIERRNSASGWPSVRSCSYQ